MSRFSTFLSTINLSTPTIVILFIVLTTVWILNLRIFYRIKNQAAFITVGMVGLFVLMMVFVRPVATMPLARIVAAVAGFIGRLTGTFTPFFKYGILFIETGQGSITLQIDFECSGIIEIMVYLSILAFYRVYSVTERAILSAVGVIYIIIANALRIVLIAVMIHFGGESMYYIAHTYIGRIFFYAATIVLYFYVFTKSQVVRMKVGSFSYDRGKDEKKTEIDTSKDQKKEEKTASEENADKKNYASDKDNSADAKNSSNKDKSETSKISSDKDNYANAKIKSNKDRSEISKIISNKDKSEAVKDSSDKDKTDKKSDADNKAKSDKKDASSEKKKAEKINY